MTRILQIRRGTTAQNNDFTGMAGELSFDTTAKTLRVHDGETLGGFALARADEIATGGDGGAEFDIDSVPAEFWENIIAAYAPKQTQMSASTLTFIANNSYMEYIFDIAGADAQFARVVLVCQTPEGGYSVSDVVAAFGIGARANPAPNSFSDTNGLHVRLMVGGESFWVSHKTTGEKVLINNDNWKAQFIVWH
ncbi:MAG: hypothetical protein LBJ73_01645 [Rickettsiales bacterium]|jgi:hypothetical protein|nr:hypothetical protein [Rickettsiales bacterium]